MLDLPIPSEDTPEQLPLPLIVAKRWNFPLAHVETENGPVYAIQDWMRGILGGDVRKLLNYTRRQIPEINAAVQFLPYKANNSKIFQRPYINEQGLMRLLVHFRHSAGRHRLVEVRNFVATFKPEYAYLKCTQVPQKQLTEYEFQSSLVVSLRSIVTRSEIREYYTTPSGRKIDVILVEGNRHEKQPGMQFQALPLLIECKIQADEFFKAIGQLICYKAEVTSGIFDTTSTRLALAMPYQCIDNYIRQIVQNLSLLLLSVVDGILIDGITGEPIICEAW
jgi:hypothetical protein